MRADLISISFVFLLAFSPGAVGVSISDDSAQSNDKERQERSAINQYISQEALQPVDYLVLVGEGQETNGNKMLMMDFMDELLNKKSRTKSDYRMLRHLFYRGHARYLKKYESFSSFSQVFEEGKYNCLTGTALYALALDHLGYSYRIVENTYHIYLIVDTEDRQYLLESTDPFNGFIYDPEEIQKRLEEYEYRELNHSGYQFSTRSYNDVNLYQLVGLHYYNVAIDQYNKNDMKSAFISLNKALIFYKSDRMLEFMTLILDLYEVPDNTRKVILQSNAIASND